MKKSLVFIILFLLLAACGGGEHPVQDELIFELDTVVLVETGETIQLKINTTNTSCSEGAVLIEPASSGDQLVTEHWIEDHGTFVILFIRILEGRGKVFFSSNCVEFSIQRGWQEA